MEKKENNVKTLEDVEEEQSFICKAKISQFMDKNHAVIPHIS